MNVFSISDTHLSITNPEKKMDRFGDNWRNHDQKISDNWKSVVEEDDIVLVPGDICWALKFSEGIKELSFFDSLPGHKVFCKGNHDYWWDSIKKVRASASPQMHFIQQDSIIIGDYCFGGARLWDFEEVRWPCIARNIELDAIASEKPEIDQEWLAKMRSRELNRLELSLKSMKRGKHRIVLLHYPPIAEEGNANHITKIISKYDVKNCVFGHLHSVTGTPNGTHCKIDDTTYNLVSADFLDFKLLQLI